jgi:hypothetical protein
MNIKVSTMIGALIIVFVAGVAGASILFFSQGLESDLSLKKDDFIFQKELENKISGEEVKWIRREEGVKLKEESEYYAFYIDEEKAVLFTKSDKESEKKGDILIMEGDQITILEKNVDIYSPHGFSYSVWHTNNPDIFILRSGFQDMGINLLKDEYLDINKKEIVSHVLINENLYIDLMIKGEDSEISFAIDNCLQKEEGTEIELKGINLNKEVVFEFESAPLIKCVDPGGIGSIHKPAFFFKDVLLDESFSNIKLFARAKNYEERKVITIWEEEVIINIE